MQEQVSRLNPEWIRQVRDYFNLTLAGRITGKDLAKESEELLILL